MLQNQAVEELKHLLLEGGIETAIAMLNARTECRFTSMYRFDGKMLRTLTFFDRLNPVADPPDDIPVEASYCVYVRDLEAPFHVSDSLKDFRVDGHPKRRAIQSYYGVPLKDDNGLPFGTLCHFDFQPVPISEENVLLMEEFASLLKQPPTRK